MTSYNSLPKELLYIIFQQVVRLNSFKTLFQCRHVCKNWKPAAEQLAYSEVIVRSKDEAQALLDAFQQGQESQLSPHLVKTLNFFLPRDDDEIFREYLFDMAAAFPSVEKIDMIDPDDEDFEQLREIRRDSKWQNLKCFPRLTLIEHVSDYNYCSIDYRTSLTKLVLYGNHVVDKNYESYNQVTHFLDQYKNLENLEIRYLANKGVEFFDQQIQKCHNLLKVLCVKSFDINNDVAIFDRRAEDNNNNMPCVINPRPNINKLYGYFFIRNDNALNYIMRTFTNLESIAVNCNTGGSPEFAEFQTLRSLATHSTITYDTLIKFISYIDNIPQHEVTLGADSTCISKAVSTFMKRKIGNSTTSQKPITWMITFGEDRQERVTETAHLTLISNPTYIPQDEENSIGVHYDMKDFSMHFKQLLKDNGSYINSLKFYVLNEVVQDMQQRPRVLSDDELRQRSLRKEMMSRRGLNSIFQYCSSLKYLEISHWALNHCESNMVFKNNSITSLLLYSGEINAAILYDISERLYSLKCLELRSNKWNEDNGYNYIQKQQIGIGPYQTTETRQYLNVIMPFTAFEKLDITCFTQKLDTMALKVKTAQLGYTYYIIRLDFNSTNFQAVEVNVQAFESYHNSSDIHFLMLYIECISIDQLEFKIECAEVWYSKSPLAVSIFF